MKAQPWVFGLTALNLALVLVDLAHGRAAPAQAQPSVVRARSIELVGGNGQVRAQLSVEANGEAVFRMRDARGTIRVKMGASEDGSALLLLDGSTEPGVHVLARRREGTSLTLRRGDGQQRVLTPGSAAPPR